MKKLPISIVTILIIQIALYANENAALIVNDVGSAYSTTIQALFPTISLQKSPHTSAFQQFNLGKNIEAFESQSKLLLECNKNYHFEAHYVHTVIIAIDKNQVSESITSFYDALHSNYPINFNFGEASGKMLWDLPQAQHIVLSMAQALYKEHNLISISKDFYTLHENGRFFTNDTNKPISIKYDSDAAELIPNGKNIEIIIPSDGTYSFIGGLLAKKDIRFSGEEFSTLLVQNGMRLPNGDAGPWFPSAELYIHAQFVDDFEAFNKDSSMVGSVLRPKAFEHERYGFPDHKARTVFFLIFLTIMVFYIISINRRLSNIRIRHSIVAVCVFQIILVSMGCLKALIVDNPIVETILWYGYYFAFVYIPAIYLYVAIVSGKNKEQSSMPLVYKIYVLFSTLLVVMVVTNNFHGFVFTVYNYSNSTFDYNTGYFMVMGWIYTTTCVALGVLTYKVSKMPRKNALIFPFIMNFFTIIFMVGYARRIPIFYDFDFAYSINILILLYIEACIQSKLFAANTQYIRMFSHSKLCMKIKDNEGNTVEHSNTTIDSDRDYILRKTEMLCGSFLYYEDHTELNITREKLKKTNAQLEENNIFLKKQSEVQAELASLAAEKAVYENIDSILSSDTEKIEALLHEMKTSNDTHRLMGRINIITCGIKRKCILRINTLYKKTQKVEEFLNCVGEMAEFAKLLPLKVTIGCRYTNGLALVQSMAMYELFCVIIEQAALKGCKDILVQLYDEDDRVIFSIIPDTEIDINTIDYKPTEKVSYFGETLSVKSWYDSTAVLLSFEKEKA